MTTNHYDVVIVGGGSCGLSAAAYLSSKGKKVALLERGALGGRAVTLKIKGFNFNFGAHAIYGRDTSVLKTFEKELGLNIDWQDFNPNKARYDLGDDLTAVPANVQGLFRTKLVKGFDKVLFTFEILKTMLKMETGHPHLSIQKWMEKQNVSEEVKEMMLTLASSNFFTREPEKFRLMCSSPTIVGSLRRISHCLHRRRVAGVDRGICPCHRSQQRHDHDQNKGRILPCRK